MKIKFIVSVLIVFAFSINLNAQVLLVEDFNYPAGDTLGAHGWVTFSNVNNPLSIVSPGLTYSGYIQSGIGNATRVRNYGQDAYKGFTPDSSGSIYASFMVNVDSAVTGGYFLAFLPSTSTTFYTARVYIKDSVGSILFGVSKSSGSGGPIVYTSSTYSYNTTYVIIVKYTWIAGTNTDDEIRLYVFTTGVPGTEPTNPTLGPVTGTANDAVDLGRIALRQGSSSSSPTLNLDGIRVFKSWGNLVSIQTISLVAEGFHLRQNYPNPFNPSTKINFSIPTNGYVTLKVYNSIGQEVNNLVSGKMNKGLYETEFDGSNLNSGVYFYTLRFTNSDGQFFSDTKKLLLIK